MGWDPSLSSVPRAGQPCVPSFYCEMFSVPKPPESTAEFCELDEEVNG